MFQVPVEFENKQALLSLKLKYYNLVKKPITSMDRMVNKLWK